MSIQSVTSAYAANLINNSKQTAQATAQDSFAKLLAQTGNTVQQVTNASASSPATVPSSLESTKPKTAAEQFMEYMSKTPQQHWQEAWLKQHGLTEEQFAALPPEKRQALTDQMARDMKDQMRYTAQKKDSNSSSTI